MVQRREKCRVKEDKLVNTSGANENELQRAVYIEF